jgi:outer membrane protein OmpA-like peptidoglycan-associated protein
MTTPLVSAIAIALSFLLIPVAGLAQPTVWQTLFGGESTEHARAIQNATDGSYVVAGFTRSPVFNGKPRTDTPGAPPRVDSDGMLTKIGSRGRVLWSRFYGGNGTEEFNAIALTPEGGYVMVGTTNSSGMTHGEQDFYIVRTDKLGEPLWQKHYGGNGKDVANVVVPLPDGGFIVAGESNSQMSGEVTANRGGMDVWVIRLDAQGNLLWERNFGGGTNDFITAGVLAHDGRSVVLVGSTDSQTDDCIDNHGRKDIFVLCVSIEKQLQWRTCFGGTMNDEGYGVVQAPGGNYLVCGTTFSSDGQVDSTFGGGDVWVFCINSQGRLQWSQTYGGSRNEGANGICRTFDGHYIVAGTVSSEDGQLTKYYGLYDGWVIKINSTGELIWQRNVGGSQKDEFFGVVEGAGGDYVACGYAYSRDHDLTGVLRSNQSDCYVIALKDPEPRNAVSLTPTVLMGYVRDTLNNRFVAAEVVLVDNNNNRTIYSGKSDTTYGIYTVLMPDTMRMSIGVFAQGYFPYSENITIAPSQRYGEVRKDIILTPATVGARINLYNILFDTGSEVLREESRVELNRLAEFLRRNPNLRICIHGHTDGTGDPSTKQYLSERRARQVKVFLMGLGIPAPRLEFKGWGMSKPLVPETSDYNRQLNRRVEIEIIGS